MKKAFKITIIVLISLAVLALGTLFVMTTNIPVLEPKGIIGMKERKLIIDATLLMLIVVIPVFVMTIVFSWKYRAKNPKGKYDPEFEDSNLAETIWWGVPFLIIIVLAIITWKSSHELDPFKPIESNKKPLTVQVVALEWKWLFIYPEQGIATINYLQLPKDVPIRFEITADAPMNSFWIPQLAGQIYAMPAMRTQLHIVANEIGTYRGGSSHLSGKGFAGMYFKTDVSAVKDFDMWVRSVKRSRKSLNIPEYIQLVKPTEYAPVETYTLAQPDLFDRIIMKYKPSQK